MKQLPIVLVMLLTTACVEPQRVYVWTRQEPAVFRKSPTTFEVRLKVDLKTKTVKWLEDVSDKEGHIGRNQQEWTDCQMFDEMNWQCSISYSVPVNIHMVEGRLYQYYWGEQRYFMADWRLK